jgi:hypothetical protein
VCSARELVNGVEIGYLAFILVHEATHVMNRDYECDNAQEMLAISRGREVFKYINTSPSTRQYVDDSFFTLCIGKFDQMKI